MNSAEKACAHSNFSPATLNTPEQVENTIRASPFAGSWIDSPRIAVPGCYKGPLHEQGLTSARASEEEKALSTSEYYYIKLRMKFAEIHSLQALKATTDMLGIQGSTAVNCEQRKSPEAKKWCLFAQNGKDSQSGKSCENKRGTDQFSEMAKFADQQAETYLYSMRVIDDYQKNIMAFQQLPKAALVQRQTAYSQALQAKAFIELKAPLLKGPVVQAAMRAAVVSNIAPNLTLLFRDQLQQNKKNLEAHLNDSFSKYEKCLSSSTPLFCKDLPQFLATTPKISIADSESAPHSEKELKKYFALNQCRISQRQNIANAEAIAMDLAMNIGLTAASFGVGAMAVRAARIGVGAVRTATVSQEIQSARALVMSVDTLNLAVGISDSVKKCSKLANIQLQSEFTENVVSVPSCSNISSDVSVVASEDNCMVSAIINTLPNLMPFVGYFAGQKMGKMSKVPVNAEKITTSKLENLTPRPPHTNPGSTAKSEQAPLRPTQKLVGEAPTESIYNMTTEMSEGVATASGLRFKQKTLKSMQINLKQLMVNKMKQPSVDQWKIDELAEQIRGIQNEMSTLDTEYKKIKASLEKSFGQHAHQIARDALHNKSIGSNPHLAVHFMSDNCKNPSTPACAYFLQHLANQRKGKKDTLLFPHGTDFITLFQTIQKDIPNIEALPETFATSLHYSFKSGTEEFKFLVVVCQNRRGCQNSKFGEFDSLYPICGHGVMKLVGTTLEAGPKCP